MNTSMKKNRKEGFTLIEMLVVIAMIGLLSAVILVALGPSRNKAKDTRIISDVNQARSVMEAEYNPITNTYPDYTSGFPSGSELKTLSTDVTAQNGDALNISQVTTNLGSYAFYAKLASDSSQYYCVDSSGFSGLVASAASSGVCPGSSSNP